MKKIILIVILLITLTGCTDIKHMDYNDILNDLSNNPTKANIYRTGFKYYLPRGMNVENSRLCNEILSNKNNIYYLYIDLIGYNSKKVKMKTPNNDSYYSQNINNNGKKGYVEIKTLENEKYLIEIMYNYAKIEVIVEEKDIKESLMYSIKILSSIKYNGKVIKNLLNSNVLNYVEEEYNIFNTTKNDSTIKIDYNYKHEEEAKIDTDLIN